MIGLPLFFCRLALFLHSAFRDLLFDEFWPLGSFLAKKWAMLNTDVNCCPNFQYLSLPRYAHINTFEHIRIIWVSSNLIDEVVGLRDCEIVVGLPTIYLGPQVWLCHALKKAAPNSFPST